MIEGLERDDFNLHSFSVEAQACPRKAKYYEGAVMTTVSSNRENTKTSNYG